MRRPSPSQLSLVCGLLISLAAIRRAPAQPSPAAVASFEQSSAAIEANLLRQHESTSTFLHGGPQEDTRLRHGELIVEQLSPASQPPDAMLHHWRGTAFVPGATAAQFEQLLLDFRAYPHIFAPQVVQARAQPLGSNRFQLIMRVRQKHVLTIVQDASYDVAFGHLDPLDGYSTSRSTWISEVDAPGTDHERLLKPAEEHGFLWRLNTYWTYQQRDGGLYIQLEVLSLSRAVPPGLGWVLRPYITSVPRESLEFTLRSASDALRH